MDVTPLRPTAILGTSAAAGASQDKLAEGRIFAAQVLQLMDGGSVILGVGRDRIAATSQAALVVGQKLFLKVRGSGTSAVLELVTQEMLEADGEAALEALEASHPFRLLAQGQGLGELLGDLARALAARGEPAPQGAQELARALESFAFTPGETGAELARHLASSGLSHEARQLGQALESLPGAALASAADELVAMAFAELEGGDEIETARRALGARLAGLLGDPEEVARLLGTASTEPGRGGLAGKALAEWIGPALDQIIGSKVDSALRARIEDALLLARISPRLARAVVEALLREHASLARVLDGATAPRTGLEPPDLKQWLSTAMDTLAPGPERNAVRAAFDSLEAEQFVALARAGHGDGSSWMFALRDGSEFVDARLVHRRGAEREAQPDGTRERKIERAVLGLEFSRTGPVRAELALDGNALHVRLCVSRDDVAGLMGASLGELSERLQASGRSVQLSISVRAAEDLRVPGPEADEHLGGGRKAVDQLG